ncbi:2-polyprenyl-6-methoxyphenol hydroxylase-like FAD-dependent oxidoreductase [Lipingzhangella halophila]|uniref:2-polyprenyl-6-methoxyphenol hydroxylase-like FAD-dependent oxidoreductase n=1 Tax=Lipingzhangella halophila TaxID=1783352 RepID=A0A7W7RD78_9ACTN|nr:FAD-dependent monooxygenase [Lipingzhangella halophila]MBB4929842.1 2-polyprenyl-6-methoxyphenol hydroxylase-like FAD-dependent oxidoreductase [Lipingzhangella halophila]
MAEPHAVVVGGGIGGLAAALALHRRGWGLTVCERAPVAEPDDLGLAVAPNALRGLDALDAGADVRARSARHGVAAIRRKDGRWIVRTGAAEAENRFGDPMRVLRRAELHSLLLRRLPEGALRTATTVSSVEPGDTRQLARVRTDSGELSADLVVVADGVRSTIRPMLFLEHPGMAYTGFTCWHAIVQRPDDHPVEFAESWGPGGVAGVLPLPGNEVYCYATGNAPAGAAAKDERAELARRLDGWHGPIPDLFAAAPPETVARSDVWHVDTPLPAYHKGRVAVLGDAAHAMAPTMGQGVGQAIEDAVVLAHHVDGSLAYVPTALQSYTDTRLPRTAALVQRSAQLAEAMQSDSAVLIGLRDTAATVAGRLAPGLLAHYVRPIDDWHPPGAG